MPKKKHREHTPIVSARQARFFGAEYGRAKRGEARETGMSRAELRRHLKEWGGKANPVASPNLVGNPELARMVSYGLDKLEKIERKLSTRE